MFEYRYRETGTLSKMRIKDCIRNSGFSYCFECSDYPCKLITNLEKSYNKRYQASLMENSEYMRQYGLEAFAQQQEKKYTCSKCGGIISIHDRECSEVSRKIEANNSRFVAMMRFCPVTIK